MGGANRHQPINVLRAPLTLPLIASYFYQFQFVFIYIRYVCVSRALLHGRPFVRGNQAISTRAQFIIVLVLLLFFFPFRCGHLFRKNWETTAASEEIYFHFALARKHCTAQLPRMCTVSHRRRRRRRRRHQRKQKQYQRRKQKLEMEKRNGNGSNHLLLNSI